MINRILQVATTSSATVERPRDTLC